jgi:hypothetical protein
LIAEGLLQALDPAIGQAPRAPAPVPRQ